MSLVLFIIFILVPIIEIYLFIEIGGQIGGGFTILLILATAIIGVSLARWQGLRLLMQARHSIAQGQPPITALGHGAMLLLAGALLITPGFFTDSIGFLLLVPRIRMFIAEIILGSLIPLDVFTRFSEFSPPPHAQPHARPRDGEVIIETAFEVYEEAQINTPHTPNGDTSLKKNRKALKKND